MHGGLCRAEHQEERVHEVRRRTCRVVAGPASYVGTFQESKHELPDECSRRMAQESHCCWDVYISCIVVVPISCCFIPMHIIFPGNAKEWVTEPEATDEGGQPGCTAASAFPVQPSCRCEYAMMYICSSTFATLHPSDVMDHTLQAQGL